MRWKIGTALMALAIAAPAQAQGDFSGTWVFQSDAYNADSRLSGVAIATRQANGQYSIRLTALSHHGRASSAGNFAYQICNGVMSAGTLRIDCAVTATSAQSYSPDNFVVSAQSADIWRGTFRSNNSAAVVFIRAR